MRSWCRPASWLLSLVCLWVSLAPASLGEDAPSPTAPTLLLVVGAAGEAEFGTNFLEQAEGWTQAGTQAGACLRTIGLNEPGATHDLDHLRQVLASEPKAGEASFWLVLIGHGTFDNREARFNLRGPDFTASELADWLKPFERPLVVINAASSSSPFLAKLSAANRVVITATRSGHEQNFTRLGSHLAQTIADPASDLDQDGQTSLLEAFLSAATRVAEFYQTEGRLATEHALIDDNGDGLGTPADWYRGVRVVKRREGGGATDGLRAHQLSLVLSPEEQALPPAVRARRDALELQVFQLRDKKAALPEDEYYRRLETLLLELARLQGEGSS